MFDREMMAALEADGEKLRAMTDEDHGPHFVSDDECFYCQGEPEPGWIETDNNGPIVPCIVCNRDGKKPRL